MKILYGVCSEGMGHAVRSAVVADHLASKGHELLLASSCGAAEHLRRRGFEVVDIPGLSLAKRGNAIARAETVLQNVIAQALGALTGLPSALKSLGFAPDAVLTDFDPWSARLAHVCGAPLIALDSIHFLSRCKHPTEFLTEDSAIALPIVEAMVPFAAHYFVFPLVFSYAPPLAECAGNTSLHLPVIRPEILAARGVGSRGHLTAYVNDFGACAHVLDALARSGIRTHVWASGPGAQMLASGGAVVVRPFDDQAFVADLASCRAVVGTAGSLLGEAACLGKPVLAIPVGGHWEQWLNGAYLERLGFGESRPTLTIAALRSFLDRVPMYAEELRRVRHDSNRELFAALDRKLAQVIS